MSTTSNENNSDSEIKNVINDNSKPKFSFSTDYHVDLLHNSLKMIDPEERTKYNRKDDNETNNSNTKSHKTTKSKTSISENMEDYLANDGNKLSETENNKYVYSQNGGNNPFIPNNTLNIFGQNEKVPNVPNNYNPLPNFGGGIQQKQEPQKQEPQKQEPQQEKQQSAASGIFEDYDNYNDLPPDAQMLKKLDMLRKLGELAQYGVKLSQNYNMNSDYFTMKYEYELHKNIRAKQNSVNWMSSLMLNCIYGVELMNEKYNPFDLKLTGWSEQINADINNYYDVFGEIYEKYNKPGKNMSPELKLMLMVGGSALKFHLNNTLLSNPVKMGLPLNPNSQQFDNIDPRVLEQMRQQSALDKMRQEQNKQNELLKEKMEKEHNLANQQVQDMMFLQQKKTELEQQEAKKKADIEQFEQMKKFFEQQEMKNNIARQPTISKIAPITQAIGNMNSSPYANLRDSINPGILNQHPNVNTQQMFNQNLNTNLEMENLRRTQINSQFNQMKEQLKKMNVSEDSDKPKSSPNVKRRSNISVDTSSSSEKSNVSKTSSDTIKSSLNSNNQNSKFKVVPDKSLNSKNNASTFSKRRYKRNTLSVST
jgi:hypothetical protein